MELSRLIEVARGDAPADLVLANGRIVNTFTGGVEEGNVAIYQGRIAGVGDYTWGKEKVDVGGRFLCPGLIDGHVHIESSYLHVGQYARAVIPRGTLAVVADAHEIANVKGLEGLRYFIDCARRVPMEMFFTAPSCVPATALETSGAKLGPQDVRRALRWRRVVALGEMMNFPGVIGADEEVLAKIGAAQGRVRDGHAPRVRGKELNAYLCPLIGSDHETTGAGEAREKLRRGMRLMIREGSSEKNLEELLPVVDDGNYHRCMLVVDDRNAKDLYRDGDMDAVVRKAIALGLEPVRAIQMATLTPAEYFRLEGLGAIAPGYWANILILGDLREFRVEEVFYRGRRVARDGRALFSVRGPKSGEMTGTMRVKPFRVEDLSLRAGSRATFPVIEVVPGQIVTRWVEDRVSLRDGQVVADASRDLMKLVVIERHRGTGNIGVGLVKGLGLKEGAMGTSVAHDSHNIVVAGADDRDIYAVAKEIEGNEGGLAVASGGKVLGALPLPIAGLMSPEPLEWVAARVEELEGKVWVMGCRVASPFSVLSFLALPVIPELKLTDMGLVDSTRVELVRL
ncbi:MAG: adenine deaminase [Chloroflexi bacterium]|nr:adenine deaminase [Chloroflexota bacterium]